MELIELIKRDPIARSEGSKLSRLCILVQQRTMRDNFVQPVQNYESSFNVSFLISDGETSSNAGWMTSEIARDLAPENFNFYLK